METGSAMALQVAVHEALAGDGELTALLGGARIHDDVPYAAEFPYVTIGDVTSFEAGTADAAAEEHAMTLTAWSRAGGRGEVQAVMARIRTLLHDRPLALDGHVLVNLRHVAHEARREADGRTFRGIVRFRAVTEPA